MDERTNEQIDVIINDGNKERIFIRKVFAIARRYYPLSDVRAMCKLTYVVQQRHVAESNDINSMTARRYFHIRVHIRVILEFYFASRDRGVLFMTLYYIC